MTKSHGFTVLELLAALTLSSLLLVGLLGTVGLMSNSEDTISQKTSARMWHNALTRQLRWDFENSRQFELKEGRLTLIGFASRDQRTGLPLHRPARVVYENVRAGNVAHLVRRETDLDSLSNKNTSTQLACCDTVELSVQLSNDEAPLIDATGSLPTRLSLLLYLSGQREPIKVAINQ